jgi:hypothetical protein
VGVLYWLPHFFTSRIRTSLISIDDLKNMNAVVEHTDIHKLINSIWNEEKLPEGWKESIIIPMYEKGDKAELRTKFYPTSCCQG